MTTKVLHKVEIIHEPSGAYLNYDYVAGEETDLSQILGEFIHDLSIVVVDTEEIEEEEEENA